MNLQKPLILITLIISIILTLPVNLRSASRVYIAPHPLPNVSSKMETPDFWIKKIKNPGRLLLKAEDIQRMNEEHLIRQDLFLWRVKDLKEEWTREELQTLFKEDWGSFGKTEEIRYGRYGHPLGEPFWNELKDNLNEASLKDINRILFALIIKRTDIRVFPTDELSMSAPTHYEFDRFQHSSVSPGSLIGIYCFSKDKRWAYVQTSFVRGWVRSTDLAIAKGKNEAVNPSTPRPKGQGLLRVDPERRFFTPSLKTGLGAAEWVNKMTMEIASFLASGQVYRSKKNGFK